MYYFENFFHKPNDSHINYIKRIIESTEYNISELYLNKYSDKLFFKNFGPFYKVFFEFQNRYPEYKDNPQVKYMYERFRQMEDTYTQYDILTLAMYYKKDGHEGIHFNGILDSISIEELKSLESDMDLCFPYGYEPPIVETCEKFKYMRDIELEIFKNSYNMREDSQQELVGRGDLSLNIRNRADRILETSELVQEDPSSSLIRIPSYTSSSYKSIHSTDRLLENSQFPLLCISSTMSLNLYVLFRYLLALLLDKSTRGLLIQKLPVRYYCIYLNQEQKQILLKEKILLHKYLILIFIYYLIRYIQIILFFN